MQKGLRGRLALLPLPPILPMQYMSVRIVLQLSELFEGAIAQGRMALTPNVERQRLPQRVEPNLEGLLVRNNLLCSIVILERHVGW